MHRLLRLILIPSLLIVPAALSAQGTLADYQRAIGLRDRLQSMTVGVAETPHWINATDRFWYRRTVQGGHEFVMVNASTVEKSPPFDHARLAQGLSAATGETYTATTLPFSTFDFADNENSIEVIANGGRWRCTVLDYRCGRIGNAPGGGRGGGRGSFAAATRDTVRISPDQKMEAYVENYNVWVRPRLGTGDTVQLSRDGSEGDAYDLRSIDWSPDSKKVAAYRVRPGYQRMVHYVESSPDDQLQPKYSENFYRKPGDVVDLQTPVLFDVATHRETNIDNTLFPNPYSLSRIEWRDDGRAFTFEYNQRGHQAYRVVEVNATSGAPRAVISEETKTFFNYRPANGNQTDSGRKYRFDVNDGREVIWMSERDGWNHLYLYDGVTGRVKNQITKGSWVVRAVDSVDVAKRQIWFRASGMKADQDPYFVHYYRINFDGTGLVAYTEANGNHTVVFSPDLAYYVDTYSRVDMAPVMELHRTSDRSKVEELERGTFSAELTTGWKPPEVFVAKGRDGTTDIWGIIIRPTNFDATKKYPVVEYIYAGPQGSFVPKSFQSYNSMNALAELGFIVVQIDGMGTMNRSKAFHEMAWKNLADAGFPDRILWHRAVAAKYPYYDITRVGIYGTSAGGQNSTGALLFHPEFYKVAVSAAGCHDNRMDKIWWNEQWMGWPLDESYAASSNVDNAYRLQGKLQLVVGEMDTNVDPSSTMQVVNALIKANKQFDLLVIPGANHTSGGAYGDRKRFDFFVHNLLGVEPPEWNTGALLTDGQDDLDGNLNDLPDGMETPGFFESPDGAPTAPVVQTFARISR
jgi:dipeptidyl aminopeptidase/acylaminoacyl peptidase